MARGLRDILRHQPFTDISTFIPTSLVSQSKLVELEPFLSSVVETQYFLPFYAGLSWALNPA